jgi:outer membrane biosynthesis protein TonB
MRTGLTISGVAHAALLLWSVVAFTARPLPVQSTEVPVDVISAADFSQITKGSETAKPVEVPKPIAEKLADATPVEDPTAKLGKKDVKATTDTRTPPETKPAPPKKSAQAPSDPIADELKKEANKKPDPAKPENKPAPKKPAQQPTPPGYDARKIAALLDKRDPERVAAVGDSLTNTVSLGAPSGEAAVLSASEIDALRKRLHDLWNPPVGARDPTELVVEIEFRLKRDGTLDGGPQVITSGHSQLFEVARTRAIIAVMRGQPYTMLKPEHYEQWRDIVITFDPRDDFSG